MGSLKNTRITSAVVVSMFIRHMHGFSAPTSWHVWGKPKTGQEPSLLAVESLDA